LKSSVANSYLRWVERYLPSPFIIALLLSALTFLLAVFITGPEHSILKNSVLIVSYWQKGFWELLAFTMQMVLILLLGYTLALTPLCHKLINKLADGSQNTAQAAFIVSLATISISFFNWGLCIIFGAILSKKIADRFTAKGKAVNFGLIAASGYSGMMAWHGGLSGSAPLKVAEETHFLVDKMGTLAISQTIFSSMNIIVSISLLIIIPGVCYLLGKKYPGSHQKTELKVIRKNTTSIIDGVEGKPWLSKLLGLLLLGSAVTYGFFQSHEGKNIIDLNFINFLLLTLSIGLHQHLTAFFGAVKEGIQGVSDVIIQFPFYAGIMGMMKYSGLVIIFSELFVQNSTTASFPIFTFISGAIVNFFVPSGGAQWAVQGPIVIEAAIKLGVSPAKTVMALAYGDQITNMLQPFWALPLLGITGLKAKDILPYTSILFLIGSLLFLGALLLL
jgi:short-chain fatty acids transporter